MEVLYVEIFVEEEIACQLNAFDTLACPWQFAAVEDALYAVAYEAEAVGQDDRVVGDDHEAKQDRPPSDKFGFLVYLSVSVRCRSLGEVAQAEFQNEHWYADAEHSYDVRNEERAAAVTVKLVWKAPEITKTNC